MTGSLMGRNPDADSVCSDSDVIRLTWMTACITRVLVAMAKLAVLGWLPWNRGECVS